MSKPNLIATIAGDAATPTEKFWMFEAAIGDATFQVKIPLASADKFEEACHKRSPATRLSLAALARQHGGSVA